MNAKHHVFAAALIIAGASPSFAEPAAHAPALLGADAVLQAAAAAQPALAGTGDVTKDVAAFVEAARKLRREQSTLSPVEAANRWQALWFQMCRIHPEYDFGVNQRDLLAVLLASLPRPESWPLLAPKINAQNQKKSNDSNAPQPPSLLHALGWRNGDDAGRNKPEIRQLLSFVLTKRFDEAEAFYKSSPELIRSIQTLRNQMEAQPFEKTIERQLANDTEQSIVVPDILQRLGFEQTKAIATRLLKKPARLREISGAGTIDAFRQAALACLQELPRAPWELCCAEEGAVLYDALVAHFGDPLKVEKSQDSRTEEQRRLAGVATAWRALGFLRTGDKNRAVDLFTQLGKSLPNGIGYGSDPFSDFSGFGITPTAVYEVLRKSAVETQCSWLLRAMIALAPAANQIDDALALLTPVSNQMSPQEQLRYHELELALRLAQGNRDAAFKILEKALSVSIPAGQDADDTSSNPGFTEAFNPKEPPIRIQLRLINRALQIGLLTHHPELVQSALGTLNKLSDAYPPTKHGDLLTGPLLEAAEALTPKDRLSEAEALLARALVRSNNEENSWEASRILTHLVQVYDRANRPIDVIKLLTEATQWSMRDLADPSADSELKLYAARAFASNPTTRKKALALTHAYLEKFPSDDDGYLHLLDLEGEKALPTLEKLIAYDRWEERPLIWKAELLRKTGRLPEAEQAARAALAIDPTDGEQPPEKRVRGYAVLASILDAQGRQNDAKIYHQVVESVHIAEEGDALKQAGFIRDALAKYESAATFFADAYCIRWRLAERLMQEGRTAEAEKHYEAAFTRMPEQFGRMAHLCFGCENIFGNQTGRSAADRVLSRLSTQPKPQPQALLILARLRIQQDRPSEAYTLLQRAVELDSDYMDAWKEMLSLTQKINASASERQRIVRQILSLDPSGTHNFLNRDDLLILGPEFLWERLQTTLQRPAPLQKLFPLTAATNRMEASKSSSDSWFQQKAKKQRLLGEYARTNEWNENGWEFVQALEQISPFVNPGID